MLINSFPSGGEALGELLRQRMEYLANRAKVAAEDQDDPTVPRWKRLMVEATLLMEASEGAAALDEFEHARDYLSRAANLLLDLQLPLGAALQRIFNLPGDSEKTESVLRWWQDEFHSGSRSRERRDAHPSIDGAFDTAQQWGYYALAVASGGTHRDEVPNPDQLGALHGVLSAPIGRLRLPVQDYWTVARDVQRMMQERATGLSDLSLEHTDDVIGKSLVGLYRTLEEASRNTYLWQRLLSPVPMFDLDTALMIQMWFDAAPYSEMSSRLQRYAAVVSPAVANYAGEFVQAAQKLRPPDEPELTPQFGSARY